MVSLVPVCLVLAIVGLLYYNFWAYCASLVSRDEMHPMFVGLIVATFHCLFFPFIVAYYKVVTTHPGTVPEEFSASHPMEEGNPHQRKCGTCQTTKPDRSHHCSMCGACILKMDHHCPWVANCVGYRNHKYFLLFVGYGTLCCAFLCLVEFRELAQLFGGSQQSGHHPVRVVSVTAVLSYILALSFALSLAAFTAMHVWLVVKARTTVEMASAVRGPNPWDLGARSNWEQVMGKTRWRWLLPVPADGVVGDGCRWPTRAEFVDARGASAPASGDGVEVTMHSVGPSAERAPGGATGAGADADAGTGYDEDEEAALLSAVPRAEAAAFAVVNGGAATSSATAVSAAAAAR